MFDIIIVNVPGTLEKLPSAAPALLKANLEKNGFSCKTIDYNIEFYNRTPDEKIKELEKCFISGAYEYNSDAEYIINEFAEEIIAYNPVYLGISVFTFQNRIATEILCRKIREKSNIKIILGGQGLASGGINGVMSYPQSLLDRNQIDFYIRSEGEHSLVELLKGNITFPGINSDTFKQIDDLNALPIPNYDDYNFDHYTRRVLPCLGSRGCVRACSFCDIHSHWQYRFRSGENIAKELIHNYQKYKISDFAFGDSLINGSLREFKIFCKLIADYNNSTGAKLTWTSQFIVRNSGQLDDEFWQNLADSGADRLAIGVETGSDSVRTHMNKKFSNEDLDYNMKQFEKYNISCKFLMIVGYPTETLQDFQDTLNLFTKYKHLANTVISSVTVGSTLGILPHTPLYNSADKLNLELDLNENNWIAHDNLDLTIKERIRRRELFCKHLTELGYSLEDAYQPVFELLKENEERYTKREKIKKIIKIRYQR